MSDTIMQVTLTLYTDQSPALANPEDQLIWELHINGVPFPNKDANILTTDQIDGIVRVLVKLEDEMTE